MDHVASPIKKSKEQKKSKAKSVAVVSSDEEEDELEDDGEVATLDSLLIHIPAEHTSKGRKMHTDFLRYLATGNFALINGIFLYS